MSFSPALAWPICRVGPVLTALWLHALAQAGGKRGGDWWDEFPIEYVARAKA